MRRGIRFATEPDFIIGEPDDPYLLRWYLIPRNRFFNIYLHKFLKSDDDRALHDHPWRFNISILLKGSYLEHTFKGTKHRRRGAVKFRWGKAPHRIELLLPDDTPHGLEDFQKRLPVWTLFITGPSVRQWGFYCPQGWKHWREFVSVRDGGNGIGAGCEEAA